MLTSIRFAVIGRVPPFITTLYVTYWPESSTVLLGISEVAVGAGLTVNIEFSDTTLLVDALSVTETIIFAVQVLVIALFGVNTIVFEPSELSVFEVALSVPHNSLPEYAMPKFGVPPDTVVVSDRV